MQGVVRRVVEKRASLSLPLGYENPLCFWIRPVAVSVTALHRHFTETNGFQHHGKLVLVVPTQPVRPQLGLHQEPLFEDLMAHPDVLHLLGAVRYGGFVDKNCCPVRRSYPRTA